MPFQISVRRTFCAAHQLRLPGGATEPVHGHNWHVMVAVGRETLDEHGFVMDFHELERIVDSIIGPWDNDDLNAAEPFSTGTNPSAESVADVIAARVTAALPAEVALTVVSVTEAEGCQATFRPAA